MAVRRQRHGEAAGPAREFQDRIARVGRDVAVESLAWSGRDDQIVERRQVVERRRIVERRRVTVAQIEYSFGNCSADRGTRDVDARRPSNARSWRI